MRPPSGVDRFEAAVRLARQAGALARERFAGAHADWKPDGSMVTDADLAIQAWLTAEIAVAFPEDGVLGEEGAAPAAWRTGARHVWVLDPIDGTNNFGRGIPGFAVSIGVLDGGRPRAGAVCDPLADQLFAACAGQGAWLNGRRLRVSGRPLTRRSLFSVRAPFEAGVPPFVAGWLRRYRLRRHGATALSLCYVAAGALAFVHDHGATLWDVAGAAPVVLEAGAVLTGADGTALFPVDPGRYRGERLALLAGDPSAHAAPEATSPPPGVGTSGRLVTDAGFACRRLALAEALAMVDLFHKDLGAFDLDAGPPWRLAPDVARYTALLERLAVVEVTGRVRFAVLTDVIARLITAR